MQTHFDQYTKKTHEQMKKRYIITNTHIHLHAEGKKMYINRFIKENRQSYMKYKEIYTNTYRCKKNTLIQ